MSKFRRPYGTKQIRSRGRYTYPISALLHHQGQEGTPRQGRRCVAVVPLFADVAFLWLGVIGPRFQGQVDDLVGFKRLGFRAFQGTAHHGGWIGAKEQRRGLPRLQRHGLARLTGVAGQRQRRVGVGGCPASGPVGAEDIGAGEEITEARFGDGGTVAQRGNGADQAGGGREVEAHGHTGQQGVGIVLPAQIQPVAHAIVIGTGVDARGPLAGKATGDGIAIIDGQGDTLIHLVNDGAGRRGAGQIGQQPAGKELVADGVDATRHREELTVAIGVASR